MAFFRTQFSSFGLDISDGALKLASVNKNFRGVAINGWGIKKLPSGLIHKGEIQNTDKVATEIKNLINEARGKIKTPYVVSVLPESKTFIKLLHIPKPQDKLNESIIKKSIPEISNKELDTIEITGINTLLFNFTDDSQIITKELDSVSFSLTGELDFIWNPDINKLKNNLLGINKENLSAVFEEDIGIGNASVKIFPPWKKVLPINSSKIKITVF